VPADDKLLTLIYTTLIALNQANATGNYSVFLEMGAPGFRVSNTSETLADTFAELRKSNLELSPILLLQPKLVSKPAVDARGLLRVTGFFPTRPEKVNFNLMFQSIAGKWLLFGIAADTKPVEGTATAEAAPPGDGEASAMPAAPRG